MPSKKYLFPKFLEELCSEEKYLRWISAKSRAHLLRDKKRGLKNPDNEKYKLAIHKAVLVSGGLDYYTGKWMDWELIGKYNNAESKANKRSYKKLFKNLPTVDHVYEVNGKLEFRICAWQVNDAKSDMSYKEFVELCKQVVRHSKD